ncbi:MAG: hypothetical protein EOM34_08330 [Clostridia bacterium]|nr:hypothetical protein [Clostridia bacterium]NCD02686.1 hypothetical protein [Clostridia bacterium]
MEKKIDVKNKYSSEISEINYILEGLYHERIYGYNGNNSRMDGSLQHNISELTKKLNQLFKKIEYGQNSVSDELGEIFSIEEKK